MPSVSSARAPAEALMLAATTAASPQARPSAPAVARIPQSWRLSCPDTVCSQSNDISREDQRGEIWVAAGRVCADPSPRVGRSALWIIGCDSDPLMENRGGVSVLSCEAFNGCA